MTCLGNTITWTPTLELQWYRCFRSTLTASGDDRPALQAAMHKPPSQTFIGFDLEEKNMIVKYYFVPLLKASSLGKSNLELVEESIVSMPSADSHFSVPLALLTSYIRSHDGFAQPRVEIFAVDCIQPTELRLKIDFMSKTVVFEGMLDALTLGGRLAPFSNNTKASLAELWCACFGIDVSTEALDRPLLGLHCHRTSGLLYYAELWPGEAMPTVKVYLPVRHY
ncbi:hypothetical protein NLG97_g5004 [Lecanicillium saksenae]|uniref:Uncharacterized protein n=1 Tax=Lecanicillium saksenae TaxID=468837 RepID=A0ACC1QWV6_9HYPO|nr:hypothetical protein NLG97_g5004 [Lecanicillium saksenae]